MLKDLDGVGGDEACLEAHAGIEGRLTAAGLTGWKINLHAGAAQHLHYSFAHLRIERVDQAGNE
jgi:hypothetical protein